MVQLSAKYNDILEGILEGNFRLVNNKEENVKLKSAKWGCYLCHETIGAKDKMYEIEKEVYIGIHNNCEESLKKLKTN